MAEDGQVGRKQCVPERHAVIKARLPHTARPVSTRPEVPCTLDFGEIALFTALVL